MTVMTIGRNKQLFVDDHIVAERHNVHRKLYRPIRCAGNPILEADRPWEQMGVDLLGGSVLYDEEEQLFKTWYRTYELHIGSAGGYQGRLLGLPGLYKACYAVSQDGVRWEKPDLGQVEHGGSRQNNILSPGAGGRQWIRRPNLIKDRHEPDPDKRYKMLYIDDVDGKSAYVDHTTGRLALCKAYSPDGIHWRMNVGRPTIFEPPVSPHGVLFGWDPNIRRYVHFHIRRSPRHADIDGRMVRGERSIMRSTSPDFEQWGDTVPIITLDEHWDPPTMNVGHVGNLCAILYHGVYIGFLDTMQTLDVADVPEHLWMAYSSQDSEQKMELVISRDGIRWDRVQAHWGFFRPGLWGTWDREIAAVTTPIIRNDEILFYYTGSNLPQNSSTKEHPQSALWMPGARIDGQRTGFAIGLAKLRLDGFASLDNYDGDGGTVVTGPLIFTGKRLLINARAPQVATSEVTIEILDNTGRPVEGYGMAQCDPFQGDEIRYTVTWDGNSSVEKLAGKEVQLRFRLRKAALFAFQFTG